MNKTFALAAAVFAVFMLYMSALTTCMSLMSQKNDMANAAGVVLLVASTYCWIA